MKYKNLKSRFRKKRFNYFINKLDVKEGDKILDLGGYAHTWQEYNYKNNVTIVNIKLPLDRDLRFKWLEADACSLDFIEDKSFDVVFSNSVIEHVGNIDRQKQMAKEIRRIGKKYWVQTPNKYFPIEIHFLFPYFNFLPKKLKRNIAQIWPFSFAKKLNLDPLNEMENIWSIDFNQISSLFPEANILREKFLFITKSLIASKK